MIVILTALDVEHRAVAEQLVGTTRHDHRFGTIFQVGRWQGDEKLKIALVFCGMGNLDTAALAERAINEFTPTALMFVGVAGAFKPWLQLGDVVVGSRIYAYHGGRSEESGFRSRPRAWDLDHRTDQVAHVLARDDARWQKTLRTKDGAPTPRIEFGPIASGEVLLDSTTSEVADHLRNHYNDTFAIEMESAGLASAARLADAVRAISVRGISDRADGEKEATDKEDWQPVAAANAAAFALALAANIDDGKHGGGPGSGPEPGRSPGGIVHNSGSTNIGQQNAVHSGDTSVHFGLGGHR